MDQTSAGIVDARPMLPGRSHAVIELPALAETLPIDPHTPARTSASATKPATASGTGT